MFLIWSLPFITGQTHICDALSAFSQYFLLAEVISPLLYIISHHQRGCIHLCCLVLGAVILQRQSDWSASLPPKERDNLCSCQERSACPIKSSSTCCPYLLPLDPVFLLNYGSEPRGVSYLPVVRKTGSSLRCLTIYLCEFNMFFLLLLFVYS